VSAAFQGGVASANGSTLRRAGPTHYAFILDGHIHSLFIVSCDEKPDVAIKPFLSYERMNEEIGAKKDIRPICGTG